MDDSSSLESEISIFNDKHEFIKPYGAAKTNCSNVGIVIIHEKQQNRSQVKKVCQKETFLQENGLFKQNDFSLEVFLMKFLHQRLLSNTGSYYLRNFILVCILIGVTSFSISNMKSSAISDVFKSLRSRMVDHQIKGRGVTDPAVLEAMNKVPRHLFVSSEYANSAYDDCPQPM
jgi:hypothetical protein